MITSNLIITLLVISAVVLAVKGCKRIKAERVEAERVALVDGVAEQLADRGVGDRFAERLIAEGKAPADPNALDRMVAIRLRQVAKRALHVQAVGGWWLGGFQN